MWCKINQSSKSPKHTLILSNSLSMCEMGERKISPFFSIRLRPNLKLSNHLYSPPCWLCSARRKDFAADIYRLVLTILSPMLSFTGGSDAGTWGEICSWSQLTLEFPIAACPCCALAKQLNKDSGSNISLNIHQGRFRHICPEEKEALVEFKVLF